MASSLKSVCLAADPMEVAEHEAEHRPAPWANACVRAASALAALAVVLIVVLAGLMLKADGQANRMQDELDSGRVRQYGVVAR
jgi:hypothetical protein